MILVILVKKLHFLKGYLYLHISNKIVVFSTVLIHIIISFLIGLTLAYFQYFKNEDDRKEPYIYVLFFCRALGIFFLILLFVNPRVTVEESENVKPTLTLLMDNSSSISFFKQENKVRDVLNQFYNSKKINNKFNLDHFLFGKAVQTIDSLTFMDSQTNIASSIKSVNALHKNSLGAIILVSDGNQTVGEDYEYINSKKAVYPLVIGDTTRHDDIKITHLNVNKYSFIDNKFPVEVLIYYDGENSIQTELSIYKKGKKVFSKPIKLSKFNNTTTITASLSTSKEGVHFYTARIKKLSNEVNTKNNIKDFSVEVIDERTKVLVLTSITHPDLGALKKAIERNKQREVVIQNIKSFQGNLNDYQFVVVYQPTNYFSSFFKERNSHYFIITGTKTDWKFLNKLKLGFTKSIINQDEDFSSIYNSNYINYQQEDIGFNTFPPLKDKFGKINAKNHQNLLYQKLNGFATNEPLLATFANGDLKYGVLFGEGIWKWRASSYLKGNTFDEFDAFVNNIIQFLSSNKKRERLDVDVDHLYFTNQQIIIPAFYLDQNFNFDPRASLEFKVTNDKTKEQHVFPFSLVQNAYRVYVEGLNHGSYSYKISVEGQKIQKKGSFRVVDFQIEEQFSNANAEKLGVLAKNSNGKLYFDNQENKLIEELIQNKSYATIQKLEKKEISLIQWKWILFIVIGLFTIEWFVRKYYGKL